MHLSLALHTAQILDNSINYIQDNLHRHHILLDRVLVMVIIWATLSVVYTKWQESYHVEVLDNPKTFMLFG